MSDTITTQAHAPTLRTFLAGFLALLAITSMWSWIAGFNGRSWWTWTFPANITLVICGIPTVTAYATIMVFESRRRRLIFETAARRRAVGAFCGVLAAAMTILLSALAMAWLSFTISDVLILAVSSALATALVLAFCRKRRPGRCVRCDYDISHSLDFGRCPECGTVISNL